jgi:hypothetical protein
VPYVSAVDFRLGSLRPYTAGLALAENDGTDAYLDLVIASVVTGVELDLHDDFEPPTPDTDETIVTAGNGLSTWYPPRRVRSLTSVSTRSSSGVLSASASTTYRLDRSLNAAGTAMVDGRKLDSLVLLAGSTLMSWPDEPGSIELVGKFGWAAVPDDVKRLVALRTYGMVKAKADPLTTIVQRTTIDAVMTFGPSAEEREIVDRYARFAVMSS